MGVVERERDLVNGILVICYGEREGDREKDRGNKYMLLSILNVG